MHRPRGTIKHPELVERRRTGCIEPAEQGHGVVRTAHCHCVSGAFRTVSDVCPRCSIPAPRVAQWAVRSRCSSVHDNSAQDKIRSRDGMIARRRSTNARRIPAGTVPEPRIAELSGFVGVVQPIHSAEQQHPTSGWVSAECRYRPRRRTSRRKLCPPYAIPRPRVTEHTLANHSTKQQDSS